MIDTGPFPQTDVAGQENVALEIDIKCGQTYPFVKRGVLIADVLEMIDNGPSEQSYLLIAYPVLKLYI